MPVADMSRAGFRNVGAVGISAKEDPKIDLLSQLLLADINGTRAAWFRFGPRGDADDLKISDPHSETVFDPASYEFPMGDAVQQCSGQCRQTLSAVGA